MPLLTRFFLKTALVYLLAALLSGTLLAARSIWLLPPIVTAFNPVYFHLFMVGWVTQLIFGVVYWMFPKHNKERPRGYENLGWATYSFLNAGLLLRVLAEPMNALQPGAIWGWLLVLSALLQWLAGLSFVINTWKRVSGGPKRKESDDQEATAGIFHRLVMALKGRR